jgi:hypothetical protein
VRSAFGVVHVAKKSDRHLRKTVPDWATGPLPGSTVKAYDRSQEHKLKAASGNLAAKVGGGAAGGAVGLALATAAGKKVKVLREGTKVAGHAVSGGTLRGWTGSTVAGGFGGAAGGSAGAVQLSHVKDDPKYRYR